MVGEIEVIALESGVGHHPIAGVYQTSALHQAFGPEAGTLQGAQLVSLNAADGQPHPSRLIV